MNFRDYALALVRKEMADRGINQRKLAALMGLSEPRISQALGSRAERNSFRVLVRVFDALGVEFSEP